MNNNQNVNNEEEEELTAIVTNLITQVLRNAVPSISSRVSSAPTTSSCTPPSPSVTQKPRPSPTTSNLDRLAITQVYSAQNDLTPTLEIFRTQKSFCDSRSDLGIYLSRFNDEGVAARSLMSPPPLLPPSYSTVVKQGRPTLDVRAIESQPTSILHRIPPPSYAEIDGHWSTDLSTESSEQVLLGPDPMYIWCARCNGVVITSTESQRSKFTHITAAALCVLGCWPCAMLPYCMNSCKNIYHFCPQCHYFFGMYRPW